MTKRVALLTIGTEITEGDISNRNAQRLSQRLHDLGYTVSHHMSVADHLQDIHNALGFLQQQVSIVITTGGLGPTSDDLTSQAIGSYLGLDMEFDEASYAVIVRRTRAYGFPLYESAKTQCYFPKGSTLLENRVGAANGFYVETSFRAKASADRDKLERIVVLPGPPAEIEGIWQDSLATLFARNWQSSSRGLSRTVLRCFRTTESEIAERIEPIAVAHDVQLGYRSHFPIVDVKLWRNEGLAQSSLGAKLIEETLSPWLIPQLAESIHGPIFGRLIHTLEREAHEQKSSHPLQVKWLDASTGGRLAEQWALSLATRYGPSSGLSTQTKLQPFSWTVDSLAPEREVVTPQRLESCVVEARGSKVPLRQFLLYPGDLQKSVRLKAGPQEHSVLLPEPVSLGAILREEVEACWVACSLRSGGDELVEGYRRLTLPNPKLKTRPARLAVYVLYEAALAWFSMLSDR